jgi:hypothetical protein
VRDRSGVSWGPSGGAQAVGEVGFFFSQRHVKSARTRGTSHATLFAIKKARPAATRAKYHGVGAQRGARALTSPIWDVRHGQARVWVLAERCCARVSLGADSLGNVVVSVCVLAP